MPEDESHEKKFKVLSVRYSQEMEQRIRALRRDRPDMKKGEILRHLIETSVALWETKGFAELQRIREDPEHYGCTNPGPAPRVKPITRSVPVYRSLPGNEKNARRITVTGQFGANGVVFNVADDALALSGFPKGAAVLVDPDKQPVDGDIIAIHRDGRTTLRRLSHEKGLRVKTENAEYEESGIYNPETFRGVVVAVVTKGVATPLPKE